MRFTTTSTRVAVAASALLFGASAVLADNNQCTCPPSSGDASQWTGGNSGNTNNNGGGGSISSGWTPPASYEPQPAIKEVPKIKATPQTIENGAKKAIEQLTNQNVLPSGESINAPVLLARKNQVY